MVLSRREKYVVIGASAVIAIWAADALFISPLLDSRQQTNNDIAKRTSELSQSQALLAQRKQLEPKWAEIVKSGLKNDPVAAESQVLHSLRDWAEDAGVSLTLLKPDRLSGNSPLAEIVVQAVGTGSQKAVVRLLWRIQTSAIPIKVVELQITSRKEGLDDLSVQLRVSTVYEPVRATQPARVTPTAGASGGRP